MVCALAASIVAGCQADTTPAGLPVSVVDLRVLPNPASLGATLTITFRPIGDEANAFTARIASGTAPCAPVEQLAQCTYPLTGNEIPAGTEGTVSIEIVYGTATVARTEVELDFRPPVLTRAQLAIVDALQNTPWPFPIAGIGARAAVTVEVSEAATVSLTSEPEGIIASTSVDANTPTEVGFDFAEGGIPNGTYRVTVTARDAADQSAEATLEPITVDLVRPASPRLPLITHDNGDRRLSLDATDTDPQWATVLFTERTVTATPAIGFEAPWAAVRTIDRTISPLPAYHAAYRDSAGNLSDASDDPGVQGVPVTVRWHQFESIVGRYSDGRFDTRQRISQGNRISTTALRRTNGEVVQARTGIRTGFRARSTVAEQRPRFEHLLWEPARQRLFGYATNETWVKPQNADWQRLDGFHPRCPRGGSTAVAHDRAREVTVLICSDSAGIIDRSIYEHDGAQWREVSVEAPNDPRLAGQLAYDPKRRQLIFVTTWRTWGYDGRSFENVATTPTTWLQNSASLITDMSTERLLMIARDGTAVRLLQLDETWNEVGPIPARALLSSAYDEARNKVVVGGMGLQTGGFVQLELDAGGWSAAGLRGPFAGTDAVFDGRTLARIGLDDETWRLENNMWLRERHGQRMPTYWGRAVYDAQRQRLVMIESPRNVDAPSPSLHWEWDGIAWTVMGWSGHDGRFTVASRRIFCPGLRLERRPDRRPHAGHGWRTGSRSDSDVRRCRRMAGGCTSVRPHLECTDDVRLDQRPHDRHRRNSHVDAPRHDVDGDHDSDADVLPRF